MSFTDSDLKRLQDWVGYARTKYNGKEMRSIIREIDAEDMEALLARLGAAEEVCQCVFAILDEQDRPRLKEAFKAWQRCLRKCKSARRKD